MRRRIYLLIILASVSSALSAQDASGKKKTCGCSFGSITQMGVLFGEQDEAFQIQTVNGLQYRTWMVGAGVGIDGYRYRSIPLFLQLRKEFNFKSNAFFIYNDIGINFPWLNTNQKKLWLGEAEYENGVYYDGGVGYKIMLKKQALVLSSGFSLKEFKENRSVAVCPFWGPCEGQKDVYSYSLKRLSVKLGIQL